MAKPIVMFTNTIEGARDILEDGLAQYDDDFIGSVTVSVRTPTAKVPDKGLPLVVVRMNGAPESRYPVDKTTVIRVSIWHSDEYQALELAELCHALLCATPGTDLVRATRSLTGPSPASDPDTGEPMATFTVAAHARPVEAA